MSYLTTQQHADMYAKRQLYLVGDITLDCASRIVGALQALNAVSEEPVTLFIDSGGGDSTGCFWLMDAIRASRAPVVGVAVTVAKSAAFEVFMACPQRKARKHATFLYHAPAPEGLRIDDPNFDEEVAQNRAEFEENLKLVVDRTKATEEQWRAWSREEHEFTADEALKVGIIQEVM